MSDPTMTDPSSSLAQWLHDDLMPKAKENRQSTECKWNRNRAARYADASLDPKGTWKTTEKKRPGQSDTFFGATKQKVVSGISLIVDSVFRDGRVPFMCAAEDEGAITEARETDPAAMDEGDDAAEHAESRLRRQLRHSNATDQFSKCIDDGATYGEYWTHEYTDTITTVHHVEVVPGVWGPEEQTEATKAVEWVTPWEMYRDMEVQDIHQGQYVIRCQQASAYDLRKMVTAGDAMIPKNIKKVLLRQSTDNAATGTHTDNSTHLPPRLRYLSNRKKNIETCEFWCMAPASKVEAFQRQLAEIRGEEVEPAADNEDVDKVPGRMVKIFAVMADTEIIAFEPNPGKTEYERGEFEPNNDNPDGIGVADNMESCQKVLNGAIRSYEDNTKLLANFILLVKRELMAADPEEKWFEGGFIQVDMDDPEESVSDALFQPQFHDITGSLQKLIEMELGFADMESHIPRAEQGHTKVTPQTAFELQQRLEKAGKYLGNVIKRLDEVMRRVVSDFHDFNMANPDVHDGKGDFSIITLGFDSFQNRYIRLQKLMTFLAMILANPELEKRAKLRYLLGEVAKAQDMEPDQVWKSPEEMQADEEQRLQSMEGKIQLARMQLELEELRAKTDKDEATTQKTLSDIEIARSELQQAQEKLDLDRAELVHEIESTTAEEGEIVKKSAAVVM